MMLYFHITLVSILVYCNVSAQNNPWSRSIFPGTSPQNSNSPSGQSSSSGSCSCSYSSDSSSNDDVSSTTMGTCTCQSGDLACNCVLGCGCTKTGDNVCSAVNLINKTFSDVLNGGPFMILVTPESQEFAQIDNTCLTYFNLTGSDKAVVYISIVFIDGSNTVQTFIVSDGGPGVVLAGGPNTVFKDKTFGEVPGCFLDTVYRCYLFGDDVSPANRDYQFPTYAVGPICPSRNSSCGRTAVQTLINAGYNQRYHILPGKLPHKCVTSQPSKPTSDTCAGPSFKPRLG